MADCGNCKYGSQFVDREPIRYLSGTA